MARRAGRPAYTTSKSITLRAPAKIQLAEDLSITESNHQRLLEYVTKRLQMGKQARDQIVPAYEAIDKEIACYLRLDEDDRRRMVDTRLGKGIKPWDVGIPLALVQIDEAITYLLQVCAPDQSMYGATAPKEKQQLATGFASLMNQHDQQFGHYLAYARMFFDQLKYNFGGNVCDWVVQYGNTISPDTATGLSRNVQKNVVVAMGNCLEPIDPYNILWDVSVPAVELPTKGEFFATVAPQTEFRVRKMAAEGKIFGIDRFISQSQPAATYYYTRPNIRGTESGNASDSSGFNWVGVLQMMSGNEIAGFEFVNLRCWLVPKDFGLSSVNEYQIWQLTLAQGKYIVAARPLDNAHGMLPIALGRPWDDGFESQTKSYAEHLLPYQRFSSFQLNVHQRASRKKLYGVTIYDRNIVPLMEQADLLGGKVAANPSPAGQQYDMSKAVHYINDGPDTANTLKDIQSMADLMQKILPTDMLRQVADLERATKYQAAATVQGANRRNLKIAKILDKQCLSRLRQMQMFNIFQYQDAIEVLSPEGELVKVEPLKLMGQNIEFTISDGLRGLDRLLLIETIKDVLTTIVQSQQAAAQVDIVAAINYYTSMIGDNTDFTQFKLKSPIDALPPEQKNLAYQLLQQYAAQQKGQGGPAGGPAIQ